MPVLWLHTPCLSCDYTHTACLVITHILPEPVLLITHTLSEPVLVITHTMPVLCLHITHTLPQPVLVLVLVISSLFSQAMPCWQNISSLGEILTTQIYNCQNQKLTSTQPAANLSYHSCGDGWVVAGWLMGLWMAGLTGNNANSGLGLSLAKSQTSQSEIAMCALVIW